jgi:hypothetical protein
VGASRLRVKENAQFPCKFLSFPQDGSYQSLKSKDCCMALLAVVRPFSTVKWYVKSSVGLSQKWSGSKGIWCVILSLGWNGEWLRGSSCLKMSVWQERHASMARSCGHRCLRHCCYVIIIVDGVICCLWFCCCYCCHFFLLSSSLLLHYSDITLVLQELLKHNKISCAEFLELNYDKMFSHYQRLFN